MGPLYLLIDHCVDNGVSYSLPVPFQGYEYFLLLKVSPEKRPEWTKVTVTDSGPASEDCPSLGTETGGCRGRGTVSSPVSIPGGFHSSSVSRVYCPGPLLTVPPLDLRKTQKKRVKF